MGLVGEAVNVIEVTILVKVDEQMRLLSKTSSSSIAFLLEVLYLIIHSVLELIKYSE